MSDIVEESSSSILSVISTAMTASSSSSDYDRNDPNSVDTAAIVSGSDDSTTLIEIILTVFLILLLINHSILQFKRLKVSKKSFGSNLAATLKDLCVDGRFLASLLSLFDILIEIVTSYNKSDCAPWHQIGGNFQNISGFIVRLYFVDQAFECFEMKPINLKQRSRQIKGFLFLLCVKTLILINVLGKDEQCEFDFPDILTYYLTAEGVVFDFAVTVASIVPLVRFRRKMSTEKKSAVMNIVAVNILNVLIFIVLVAVDQSGASGGQEELLMVIESFWSTCSTWIPSVLLMISLAHDSLFQGGKRWLPQDFNLNDAQLKSEKLDRTVTSSNNAGGEVLKTSNAGDLEKAPVPLPNQSE
jgi:hypothetical protein